MVRVRAVQGTTHQGQAVPVVARVTQAPAVAAWVVPVADPVVPAATNKRPNHRSVGIGDNFLQPSNIEMLHSTMAGRFVLKSIHSFIFLNPKVSFLKYIFLFSPSASIILKICKKSVTFLLP